MSKTSNKLRDRAAPIVLPAGEHDFEQPAKAGPTTEDEYLTLKEFAAWVGCSPRTIQRLLSVGDGPPVIDVSARVRRFPRRDGRSWLASRRKRATVAVD
jgi:predicted DNA-binding transcriptional regulator AlpA